MTRLGPPELTLRGRHVTLLPLSPDHAPALSAASAEGGLHDLWYTSVPSPQGMAAEIDRRLGLREAGSMIPFTTCDATGRPVGMTSFMHIDHAGPRVEIGSTWIAPSAQRGPVNTEAKRLMLGHAFEVWQCLAVEFRTHRLNAQSRRAIERLGAQLDGILRAHMRLPNGTIRDTAVYSVTAGDWPTVRAHLDWQLARPR
ncbi:GNAT family N-acetyltransferase [Roseicyclus persicicus]|uniref:GNAT family N-acetyltransferase n=1 Tax=Roseicyclus persicicus TaxID=2650661 RepID=A0A7X6JYC0_9RHOB|nr:GNAT family protein [Roseibacterium persicicum]NKX43648.1 GNAT family N-acetyltransferase [Roseibacterium persicicum]